MEYAIVSTEPAIVFSHVSRHFVRDGGVNNTAAIADLDFQINAGEHVSVVGRTGCGKSTSVNLLLGLLPVSSGKVRVLGADPFHDFQHLRGRIGCVFQSDRLLPWRSAIDNVLMPLEILRTRNKAADDTAAELLARMGLAGHEHAFPHQLSGGMRQRVAFARALITQPDILIADEAFGHLDEVTAGALRSDFIQIARARGQTVYQITHSLDEALDVSDRVLVFDRPGKVAGAVARQQWENSPDDRVRVRQFLRDLIAGGDAALSGLQESE
nr:ATP-binding cassette domain-containing protein [Brenneria tiliae]